MSVATFPLGPLGTNSYIINKADAAISIDVGGAPEQILTYLKQNNLNLIAILLTHLHFDHLYGVADLAAQSGAPVYAPAGDNVIANTESATGGIWGMPPVKSFNSQSIPPGKNLLGGMDFIALETPGHTPGGMSFYFPEQNCVFTGDALFYRSLGRTDFPGGDHAKLLKSIHEKLFTLTDDVIVYPGHGPATTIGDERKSNPFCGEFVI